MTATSFLRVFEQGQGWEAAMQLLYLLKQGLQVNEFNVYDVLFLQMVLFTLYLVLPTLVLKRHIG